MFVSYLSFFSVIPGWHILPFSSFPVYFSSYVIPGFISFLTSFPVGKAVPGIQFLPLPVVFLPLDSQHSLRSAGNDGNTQSTSFAASSSFFYTNSKLGLST
jgi:hypothetical protein